MTWYPNNTHEPTSLFAFNSCWRTVVWLSLWVSYTQI